jgi:SagB-type dehydrogenase family enzyme
LVRPERGVVALEVPGAWAKVTIHDRELLPLVHDLATGRSSAELGAEARAHSEEAISEVLALMDWCGLLDGAGADGWSAHDLFLHTQSRMGYARTVLGKTSPGGEPASSAAGATADTARRVALRLPDLAHLLAVDPPHALVSERRLSDRRHGSDPLTADQLSEFLFRTLHERGGRRPYPSAGSCYPLRAYLAVHSCAGVEPGLYAYDAAVHELTRIGPPGPGLERLLWNAAGAANIDQPPQMLLVLAARYARTRRVYGDLAYSLILKEVGAVIQTALMSAAAMGLAVCPLGCGDSLLFSDLTGVDTLTETSVGELMLGSREERLQG